MMSDSSQEAPIERVKEVLYLDGNDDDELLRSYVTAADAFVHNAVGTDVNEFYSNDKVKPLIEVAVVSLAATYYQNRLALSDVRTYPVDFTVDSIIAQLRVMRNSFEEGGKNENSSAQAQPSD